MKGIGVSTEAVKCDSFHDEQTCLSGACGMPVVKVGLCAEYGHLEYH